MNNIENDLKKCLKLLSPDWEMQNNVYDKRTNFIYKMESLEECLIEIEKTGVNKNYALHRWYNYHTSVQCEYIFCEFGATHEKDLYNHDVDIYIDSVPFDVKLTVYPAKLSDRPYDLTTRLGKNEMIRWYYGNQSQQGRKQMLNRLYLVCDGKTSYENMAMKCNFELVRKKVSAFMKFIEENGFNEISIMDNGKTYNLKSDIILLREVG